MDFFEYREAKRLLKLHRKLIKEVKPGGMIFKETLRKHIESLIAVRGHAWCMDVKVERKKMAKLMADAMETILFR